MGGGDENGRVEIICLSSGARMPIVWPRGTWYGANDTSCIFLRLSESCFVAPSCYGSDFLLLHTSRGFSKKVRRREKGNFKGIEDFSYCQVYFSRIAFRKTKKYSASILFLSVSRSDELQKVARRTKNFFRILQKKLYRVRKATSIFYNARGLLHFSTIPPPPVAENPACESQRLMARY